MNIIGAEGLKGEELWPIVAVELWQTQIAFAIGILGMYAGWRGAISKMTGFFDLAGAVRFLVYGIVSGMILAIFVDNIILTSIIKSSLNIAGVSLFAILIGAAEASFVLFLLSRKRVFSVRASPPYGWTLGLGIGSMQACVLVYRLFDEELSSDYSGMSLFSISLAFAIAITSCLGHALLATWQGAKILESNRALPLIISAAVRGALIVCLVLSLFLPMAVLVPTPFIAYYWFRAQEGWLPSGLTPAAKQAFRRTVRQADLHRERSEGRIRGKSTESEE